MWVGQLGVKVKLEILVVLDFLIANLDKEITALLNLLTSCF